MGNKITKVILWVIFLLVFNVLFFVLCGTDNSSSVWTSYGFINVAYLFLFITPLFNKGNNGLAVLSTTLYAVSSLYFIIELLVGIILIVFQPVAVEWIFSIQFILLAMFLWAFFSTVLTNKKTKESIQTSQYESMYIKEAASQLKMILSQIPDKALYKKVEKCYELMENSPIQSGPKVKEIEQAIKDKIEALKKHVSGGNQEQIGLLCNDIRMKIEERNQCLRYIK